MTNELSEKETLPTFWASVVLPPLDDVEPQEHTQHLEMGLDALVKEQEEIRENVEQL